MTNRELLEMAAKAAGYAITKGSSGYREFLCKGGVEWNPLDDDGDALRLANALKLSICHTLCEAPTAHGTAMVGYAPWEKGAPICSELYDGIEGRDAATRLAITRAAAEIGRSMP